VVYPLEGYRLLDFGRSKWNAGTYNFKASFGMQAQPLYYQFYLNKAKDVPDVDPSNSRFKALIAAWQRLPLPLVKRLGPCFIRDIP